MNITELYAELGKVYVQMENHQYALQQLAQQKQSIIQSIQQEETNGKTVESTEQ